MKKVLLCALAAVAFITACNKAEVIDVVGTPAIQVGDIFVENATKAAVDPSFTNNNLNELSLYGFMNTTSGVVFNNERLAKDIQNEELKQAWRYANTQYWTPGNTYYFGVVAPLVAENGPVAVDYSKANEYGVGEISFTQPADAGSVDVLYDAKKVECTAMQMDPVAFQMSHMLAKVKFSFTNGFGNDNAYVTVKNIRMTAPAAGSINVAQADWWSTNQWVLAEGETTLEFGDMETAKLAAGKNTESAKERLTIPASASQVYNVTFDVELYYGDQLAYSSTLETVIEGAELKIGKAYNFHATIDGSNIVPGEDKLTPIEFTVSVKDWEDGNGYDGGNISTDALTVLEKDFSVAADAVTTLKASSVATSTVAVAGTLDGAGNTVTINEGAADYVSDANFKLIALNGANVTLKNMTIDGNNASAEVGGKTYGVRNIVVDAAGKYTVDNVKSINATYPIHVRTTGVVELNVTNSTLEGWTSYNSNTTANFTSVAFTAGAYARFRPYGETVLTNCSFVDGFIIDLSRLAAGKKVTFVNCTYNGAALTDANVLTVDGAYNMAGTYEIK